MDQCYCLSRKPENKNFIEFSFDVQDESINLI